jgi:hypothetical protein
MKTPQDKKVILTFHSYPHKDLRLKWKASVTFPPGAEDDTMAEVALADGLGNSIECAEFEFAGMSVNITDGKGTFRCADFASGKHEVAIWLHRPEKESVPGMLTFE